VGEGVRMRTREREKIKFNAKNESIFLARGRRSTHMKLAEYSSFYVNAIITYTREQCNIIGVFRDEFRRIF
jgi:hypothetical protein